MPHTLLLADDSVTIQRVIELTFADEDVQVIAVSDGDQAIARIDAAPPDIILADVGMPGKSGYEVAEHVKQSPHLAHIPVVLLTGAFEPIDQARAAEAGCEGVLAKPFEPQAVIGRVKQLLSRSGQGPKRIEAPKAPNAPPPAEVFGASVADELFGAPRPASPVPASAGELNNYFDRLDQAFANLASPSSPARNEPPADADWFQTLNTPGAAAPPPEPWDIAPPPPPPQDLPMSFAAPVSEPDVAPPPAQASPAVTAPVPESVVSPPPATVPAAQASPVQMPALADAFAALLEAEQTATYPLQSAQWPAAAPAAAITEEQLEEVARRVLDRLSDSVMRDAVREAVASIAERLVREEIERIKSSIR